MCPNWWPAWRCLCRPRPARRQRRIAVFVDDGSTDGTGAIADGSAQTYPFLRVLHHRRNLGLTAALRTGFQAVRGELILFLPADLESDPETDIPLLLGKLHEGYDVVAGWRQGREEGKVLASGIYNAVSRAVRPDRARYELDQGLPPRGDRDTAAPCAPIGIASCSTSPRTRAIVSAKCQLPGSGRRAGHVPSSA